MLLNQLHLGTRFLSLTDRTIIMGILNLTPDSFSDGGKYTELDTALWHTESMLQQGADIIDIGGESTRPGSTAVVEAEELERVIPIVEAIAKNFDIPISIDTYKAKVAEEAIKAGAHMINDVWGGQKDPRMNGLAARLGVPYIIMHNRDNQAYHDLIADIIQDLQRQIDVALKAGVKKDQIILDPGIGFAKSWKDNMVVMKNLNKITALGYPVLLGTSRKSMIGQVLNLPPEERVEGTIATVCLGIQQGCHIVRVHDVKEVARAAKMMDAMLGKPKLVKELHIHG